MSARDLQQLNRPGEWLLDCVPTVCAVLRGALVARRRLKYQVLDNRSLAALMRELRIHHSPRASTSSSPADSAVHLGNQVEHLAWLALEADKPELILALSWQDPDNGALAA